MYAAMAASFVASAAGAYVQYKTAKDQGKAGEQSVALQREQISSERATASLQAREQEAERQRRAGVSKSAGIAGATGAGFDYWLSPTAQTAATENDRLVEGDISAIRLLGAAGQRKYALQDRGAEFAQSTYQAAGANAWIAPTLNLLKSAANMAMGMSGGAGAGAGAGSGAPIPASTTAMSSIGRAAGPV